MALKKISLFIILFSFIIIFPCCTDTDNPTPDKNSNYYVNVYSRTNCPLCTNLVAALNQTDIVFSDYDIDVITEKEYEMQQLAYDYGLLVGGMTIELPLVVLFVDSTDVFAWSNPSVDDIQNKMDELDVGN